MRFTVHLKIQNEFCIVETEDLEQLTEMVKGHVRKILLYRGDSYLDHEDSLEELDKYLEEYFSIQEEVPLTLEEMEVSLDSKNQMIDAGLQAKKYLETIEIALAPYDVKDMNEVFAEIEDTVKSLNHRMKKRYE